MALWAVVLPRDLDNSFGCDAIIAGLHKQKNRSKHNNTNDKREKRQTFIVTCFVSSTRQFLHFKRNVLIFSRRPVNGYLALWQILHLANSFCFFLFVCTRGTCTCRFEFPNVEEGTPLCLCIDTDSTGHQKKNSCKRNKQERRAIYPQKTTRSTAEITVKTKIILRVLVNNTLPYNHLDSS